MKRVKVFPTFANGSGCSFANESVRKLGLYINLANHCALEFAKNSNLVRQLFLDFSYLKGAAPALK